MQFFCRNMAISNHSAHHILIRLSIKFSVLVSVAGIKTVGNAVLQLVAISGLNFFLFVPQFPLLLPITHLQGLVVAFFCS